MTLGFLFHVHSLTDMLLAGRLIRQIREHYPLAPVQCIADGCEGVPELGDLEDYCHEQNVFFYSGFWLKSRKTGGLWIQRMMKLGLELDCEFVVKLDPDSYLHRPIVMLPDGDMSGAVRRSPSGIPYIRGGCIAFSHQALTQMANARELHDPVYTEADKFCYRKDGGRLIPITDHIMGDVARKLGLTLSTWDEVAGGIKGHELTPANVPKNLAVTHPVYLNDRDHAIRQALCVPGFMDKQELLWLYNYAVGACVEIGSYQGRSAIAIGYKLQQCGGHLTCIDPWEDYINSRGQTIKASEAFTPFCQHLAACELPVSYVQERSPKVAEKWQDGSLDMVFLDGDHTRDALLSDIQSWMGKLKPNGLLCGHDYNLPEVKNTLRRHNVESVGRIWYMRVFR